MNAADTAPAVSPPTVDDGETAIRLIDIHKRFGAQVVLDGLSIDIPRGKITFIIGPSGTGKSVTLKHMIGLVRPDRGAILLDGEDIAALSEREMNRRRRKFGMLFQDAALFDSMTVFENVAFPLREHTRMSRSEIRDRVHADLEAVGLRNVDHKYPSELSGGMRKRVGLARAVALDPPIILYDEPTTGLDPLMTTQVDELIAETNERRRATSIVISHDIPAVFHIADLVAFLHKGRVAHLGPPESLHEADDPAVRHFVGEAFARRRDR